MRASRLVFVLPMLLGGLSVPAGDLRAQAPDSAAVRVPIGQDTTGVSPGGAFLRSLVLPAWGHASIDSGRGAFYTFTEAGSAWMLVRLRSRLRSAREILAVREAAARAEAIAEGITDEAAILEAIDDDESVGVARERVEAREQQREDWAALAIFSVLLSGVDAFVSAHLQDFPEMPDPVQTGFAPSPWGGMEFGVRVHFPPRR